MTQDPTRAVSEPVHAQQTPKVPTPRKVKPPVGAVHRLLRTATREDHASIDRMLLRFDLNRLEDYRIFLTIHLAALSALQAEWRPEDDADFSRMLDCLRADLKALGWTTATPPASAPTRRPAGWKPASGASAASVSNGRCRCGSDARVSPATRRRAACGSATGCRRRQDRPARTSGLR